MGGGATLSKFNEVAEAATEVDLDRPVAGL